MTRLLRGRDWRRLVDEAPPPLRHETAITLLRPTRRCVCPSCGSEIDGSRLHIDLQTNVVSFERKRWRLAPQLAEFLFALNEAWPRSVTYFALSQALWGAAANERDELTMRRALAVSASKLRHVLHQCGADIRAIPGRGFRIEFNQQEAKRS